jgi:hypothetical protein
MKILKVMSISIMTLVKPIFRITVLGKITFGTTTLTKTTHSVITQSIPILEIT